MSPPEEQINSSFDSHMDRLVVFFEDDTTFSISLMRLAGAKCHKIDDFHDRALFPVSEDIHVLVAVAYVSEKMHMHGANLSPTWLPSSTLPLSIQPPILSMSECHGA